MFGIFRKKIKQAYTVQQYHTPELLRMFYIALGKEPVTPQTSMESQAHYWCLLLANGYQMVYEDGSKDIVFIKGEEMVKQIIVGVSDE
jgi:hypothetical protein